MYVFLRDIFEYGCICDDVFVGACPRAFFLNRKWLEVVVVEKSNKQFYSFSKSVSSN